MTSLVLRLDFEDREHLPKIKELLQKAVYAYADHEKIEILGEFMDVTVKQNEDPNDVWGAFLKDNNL